MATNSARKLLLLLLLSHLLFCFCYLNPLLPETTELARYPEVMQEMMRNQDWVLSNPESTHPLGFILLHREFMQTATLASCVHVIKKCTIFVELTYAMFVFADAES